MSDAPDRGARREVPWATVGGWFVGSLLLIGAGPALRARIYLLSWWPRAILVVVVAAVASALVTALATWRLPRVLTLAVAAGAGAVGSVAGSRIAVWIAANVVLASWVLLDRAPLPGLRGAKAATPAVVGLTIGTVIVVADWDRPLGLALGMVALASAITVTASIAPNLHRRLDRFARFLGQVAGWLVTRPLLGILWVLVSGLPWLTQRLFGVDATTAPCAPGSRWVQRRPEFDRPDRMWNPEVSRRRLPVGHRIRSSAAALVALVAIVPLATPTWAVARAAFRGLDTAPESGAPQNTVWRGMMAEPWAPEVDAATRTMWEEAYLSQWVGVELPDLDTPYLRIADGRRRSWAPTEGSGCAAPLRVWFLGGSTVFGVGLPDDHTLPSEVARVAARDGVRLLAENWGVPGDVTWQENRRAERALLRGDPPPDLVVFYDGWNDLTAVSSSLGFGRDRSGDYLGPLDNVQMRAMKNTLSEPGGQTFTVQLPGGEDPANQSDDLKVRRAVEQYAAGHEASERLLGSWGLPWVRFLQPNVAVRKRTVPGEGYANEQMIPMARAFRRAAPEGVIDLSAAFDEVDEPLYVDDVHTNRRGNEILAEVLYAGLRDRFGPLLAGRRGQPCG